jgi:small-conductance mechanosensitive channel
MFQNFLDYLREVDWGVVARMAGLSIAIVLGQILFYIIIKNLFKKVVNPFLANKTRNNFKGIKFRNYMLLTPMRLTHISFLCSRTLMYAILITSLYISITLLFVIHPTTRELANTLFRLLMAPILSLANGFVAYIPNLLRIIVIIAIVHYFLKCVKFVMKEVEEGKLVIPGFYADWASATFNLFRFLSYAFMAILIFPLLPDSETVAFRGVSVFLGVLFSLGSTTIIANIVAGLVLTYMRSFKLGDRVKVGDVLGDVVEKTPFAVRIKTSKKEIVTVPNGTLLSSNVVNFSTAGAEKTGVILYMPVSVCYNVPWRQAAEIITAAARKTDGVLDVPAPFVLVKNLDNDATEMELNIYTNVPEEQPRIFSEINENLRDLFEASGIDITVPRLVSMR